MKKVVVIGAGPAGLTAAYELSKQKKEYDVVVYEESGTFGGISRTVNYKGNRMDKNSLLLSRINNRRAY